MLIRGKPRLWVIMAPASIAYILPRDTERHMPSLFRFVLIIGFAVGLVTGSLFVLSEYFEPSQREVRSTVSGVKVRQ